MQTKIKKISNILDARKNIVLVTTALLIVIVLLSGIGYFSIKKKREVNSGKSRNQNAETKLTEQEQVTTTPTPTMTPTIQPTTTTEPTIVATATPSPTPVPTVVATVRPTVQPTRVPVISSVPTATPTAIVYIEPATTYKTFTIPSSGLVGSTIQIPSNWNATYSYIANCSPSSKACFYVKVTGANGEYLEFNYGSIMSSDSLPLAQSQTGALRNTIFISGDGMQSFNFMENAYTKSSANGVTGVFYGNEFDTTNKFLVSTPAMCACPNIYMAARGSAASGKYLSNGSLDAFNKVLESYRFKR